jgi:hypothetical protein
LRNEEPEENDELWVALSIIINTIILVDIITVMLTQKHR